MHRKTASIATTPVQSSNIAAVGHDSTTNTLRVHFRNGGVYDYTNVSAEEHQALIGAKSIGKHLHEHIRNREYSKVA